LKLVATRGARTDKTDQLRCLRADGSATSTPMPRQGILPHDLVHYVVESTLGWRAAFYGMVAGGADIGWTMERTHDAGASDVADQAIHAEAVVESLQAQLWSGAFDATMFADGVRAACAAPARPAPLLPDGAGQALFAAVLALDVRWQQVPWHGTLALDLPD
jgi:hypothetical protein